MKRIILIAMAALLAGQVAGQVVDSVAYEAPVLDERSYEEQFEAARKAERKARREQREAEIGRGLRWEFAPAVGLGGNTYLGHRGDPYSHHTLDATAALLMHWPLSRRFDLSVGLGFRLTHIALHNSVQFDTASSALTGYNLDGWRAYSCWLTQRSLVVPVRINVVTNQDYSVYLGANLVYQMNNTFNYERMAENDSWTPVDELAMNNIETVGTWKVEVAVGMTYPLWWILRWGWEVYYSLTPTFDTSIPHAPATHEFGIRLNL